MGRKKLEEADRKGRVSITMSKDILASVDRVRGTKSRSEFIEGALALRNPDKITSESNPNKQNGIFYTPAFLADYVADKAVEYFEQTRSLNRTFKTLSVLDPACGKGELLTSTVKALSKSHQLYSRLTMLSLTGIDIDESALNIASERLTEATLTGIPSNIKFKRLNSLFPLNTANARADWNNLIHKLELKELFDIVIANPPWGADYSSYSDLLSKSDYTLFNGNTDTSDLFLELSLRITRQGGIIAFIIPDSVFYQDRKRLRKLLLQNSTIHFIGRFGEKLFDEVNRGCSVVILSKRKPTRVNKVHCFHLPPSVKADIVAGNSNLKDADDQYSHYVPQKRFLNNVDYNFDIDLKIDDEKIVRIIEKSRVSFGDFLSAKRGIELSKKGKVAQCPSCKLWLPYPKNDIKCPNCGDRVSPRLCRADIITSKEPLPGSTKLIVGENMRRYRLQGNYWVDTSFEGINYKSADIYKGPKLLVRKTGVGVTALIDNSDSYVNQVVYIFKLLSNSNSISLETILGILNSRAIYFLIAKTYGETEWKTHPYITQKHILNLPLPTLSALRNSSQLLTEIDKAVMDIHNTDTEYIDLDAYIEKRVARLYGLTKSDYEVLYSFMHSVQDLIPVKVLTSISIADIFGDR